MKLPKASSAMLLGCALLSLATAPFEAAAQVNSSRQQSCEVGSACWRQRQADAQFLAEQQRARQLRQYGIDRGKALRSENVYPGYRDTDVQVFRPGRPIVVDPHRR